MGGEEAVLDLLPAGARPAQVLPENHHVVPVGKHGLPPAETEEVAQRLGRLDPLAVHPFLGDAGEPGEVRGQPRIGHGPHHCLELLGDGEVLAQPQRPDLHDLAKLPRCPPVLLERSLP
jgi:hypothetical protein